MLTLKVSGITCSKCVEGVTRAVKAVPAVTDVTVDLDQGLVTVAGNPDEQAVRTAITEEGYDIL
ncbi:MAG: heavy-metal-associated domain-containing protein [Rhodospirillales bacterium]|nr:heavy-metal-associated domain-containing protein [Rhodospirillales bacterium]MDE2458805.1 heavy-metal-associated domain-containing protein [Rhodospirillales bacterium]